MRVRSGDKQEKTEHNVRTKKLKQEGGEQFRERQSCTVYDFSMN